MAQDLRRALFSTELDERKSLLRIAGNLRETMKTRWKNTGWSMFRAFLLAGVLLSGCKPVEPAKIEDVAHIRGDPIDGVVPIRSNQTDDAIRQRDFDLGYQAGKPEGEQAARKGAGIPYDIVFREIAKVWAKKSGANSESAWREGYKKGFKDGFATLKPLPNTKNLRTPQLLDMKKGVLLFDNNGEHACTVFGADFSKGHILVQYPSGSIEPKLFETVERWWFVKEIESSKP